MKAIIGDVDTMMAPNGVLLYLDEIQYFNKKQQQSLLEFMENGKITLIASTTENPFFYVYNALLSRSTVFEFKALTPEETVPAVERALALQQRAAACPSRGRRRSPAHRRRVRRGCPQGCQRCGALLSVRQAQGRRVAPDDGGCTGAGPAQCHAI